MLNTAMALILLASIDIGLSCFFFSDDCYDLPILTTQRIPNAMLGAGRCVRFRYLYGVRSGLGQGLDKATELGVVREVVFIPKRSCWREDADVELLSQV